MKEIINSEKNLSTDKDSNSDSIDLNEDSGMDFSIPISFYSKNEYLNHLESLIEDEIETILIENENLPLLPFDLEFGYTEENNCFITVKNPNYKLFKTKTVDIYNEDELIIENAKIRFKIDDSIILCCENISNYFKNGRYQIKLVESIKNYERIIFGLNDFSINNLMNENIIQLLLGQNPDLNINIRKEIINDILLIPKLKEEKIRINSAQETAIRNALKFHLSLVIGPPGSGKTLLLINLVYNILQRKETTEKILICAPTNKAIDNIIILLKKFGFEKYVRVLSPDRELSEDLDTSNSVHKLALERINSNPEKYEELIQLIEKKEKNIILSDSDYQKYKNLLEEVEDEIIKESNIVLSTINNSADIRLINYSFSYVLIDEAAQDLEPDTLLPLMHLAQMVVLIGDDKQLGPVVHSKEAKYEGLGMSLFERLHLLYKDAPFITLLNEQYRMNEKLYEFPNRKFYENKMITKRKILPDENIMKNLPFPKKDFPSFFIHVSGKEKAENNSYYNYKEVLSVFKYVNELNKNNIEFKDIGVITFYSAQKQRLYEKFYKDEKYQELKIDSVDGFQGMELDYIILSTVRSNFEGNLGFLKDENRLNVALTRARKGLIIVGNAKCLAKRPGVFRDLIEFYCSNGLILNNPFDNKEVPEIKKKKKKKVKKNEEEEEKEEEDEKEEEEDLKKKGNKKWKIKNLCNKKKKWEQKYKEKEEENKVEKEKKEGEDKKGKKGRKNKGKQNDNDNEAKGKKNSNDKGKRKKK